LVCTDFISKHKSKPGDFSRKRNFSFKSLSLFILSSIQSSIQRELDRFFKSYNNKELTEQFVSQSAFSQARLKLKPSAFIEMSKVCTDFYYSHYEVKKWKCHRLVAIDGSEAMLPKNDETIAKFGEYQTNLMNKTIVLSRISKAYDVLNDICIDAIIDNKKRGEHSMAKSHFQYLEMDDLVLLDRGYPSYDLFNEILTKGGQFCARVAVANWKAAKELIGSGEKESIRSILPGYELRKKYKEEGKKVKPINCRFVCVELGNGEKEVLITSLLDSEKYVYGDFKELYHLRWVVEESYKIDKHRLKLENFSGKSIVAIKQDFYAMILLSNITHILSSNLEKEMNTKRKNTKYQYKANITTALAKVREVIPMLFTRKGILKFLDKLIQMFLSNTKPIRPNRSFERSKGKRRRYHTCYQSL